jgi:hypothetical protein
MTRDHTAPAPAPREDVDAHEPADARRPADLAALLADPAVWAEPSDDLEDRVVAAVSAEAQRR